MKELRRHDLLEIDDEGRRSAFELAALELSGERLEQVRQIILGESEVSQIPGIVRREEAEPVPGMIPVGFASPWRLEGTRLRIAAFVSPQSVQARITPWQVLNRPFIARTPCLKALAEIRALAGELKQEMGVWGSAALEIFTGLEYTHEKSDLDLLLGLASAEGLHFFNEQAVAIANKWNTRVDFEVELPSGHGVKLLELFAQTHTVLAKGLNDVVLLEKHSVLAMLENQEQLFLAESHELKKKNELEE